MTSNTTTKYIRAASLAKRWDCSKGQIWNLAKAGRIPKPFKLSPQVTVWHMDEIEAYEAEIRLKAA